MRIFYLLLSFLIPLKFCQAQADTIKVGTRSLINKAGERSDALGANWDKQVLSFYFGNAVKNGLGTMMASVGYRPCPYIEFYLAPTYGLFTGGASLIGATKINLYPKHKLYSNIELAFRHSIGEDVNYENHASGGQESYRLPPTDYLVVGAGLNYRLKKPRSSDETSTMVSLALTYSFAMRNYHYSYLTGPFSPEGEDGATRKISSGWGFTILLTMDMRTFNRKNKALVE